MRHRPARAAALLLLLGDATKLPAPVSAIAIKSTVYTHGENGWPCYRIPGTLALPFDVMLSFAAARSFTGDVRRSRRVTCRSQLSD